MAFECDPKGIALRSEARDISQGLKTRTVLPDGDGYILGDPLPLSKQGL
jgi:hypothetical protein